MSHKVFKILINAIVCLTVLFLFSLITQKFIEIKTLSNVIFRSVPISYTLKSKEIQKDFLTRYIIVVEKNTLVYKVKVDKQIYYYLNTKLPNLHYNKKYDIVYSQAYLEDLYHEILIYFASILIILLPFNFKYLKYYYNFIKNNNIKSIFTNYKINFTLGIFLVIILWIFYNSNQLNKTYNVAFNTKNIQFDILEIFRRRIKQVYYTVKVKYNGSNYNLSALNIQNLKEGKELVFYNRNDNKLVSQSNFENRLFGNLMLMFLLFFILLPYRVIFNQLIKNKWFHDLVYKEPPRPKLYFESTNKAELIKQILFTFETNYFLFFLSNFGFLIYVKYVYVNDKILITLTATCHALFLMFIFLSIYIDIKKGFRKTNLFLLSTNSFKILFKSIHRLNKIKKSQFQEDIENIFYLLTKLLILVYILIFNDLLYKLIEKFGYNNMLKLSLIEFELVLIFIIFFLNPILVLLSTFLSSVGGKSNKLN